MSEGIEIVVATGNRHKVAEIRAILGPRYRVRSMLELDQPRRLVEDESTFEGNAVSKARQLAAHLVAGAGSWLERRAGSGVWVLADDSGLEVDALGGAPGVRSARFAGDKSSGDGNAPDAANNAKLLRLMTDVPETGRAARFRCVLALLNLVWGEPGAGVEVGTPELFEGTCEGRIGYEPRGSGGFGYDPVFYPAGQEASFAELGEAVKNRLSHRYRALERMRRWLVLRSGAGIA